MNEFPKVPEGILGEDTVEKTNTELFLSLVGQYFPEAIKDGEVDFTALKEEMGEFPQVSSEHYEFTWAGKQAAKKEAMSDIYGRTLKYKPQDSLNPDTTENIYIEGDNLEALKLLRRNYHGKIKMIYIDPPYNRGSDLIYCDTFTLSEEEIAKLSGDTIGKERLQKVSKDDAKYHTKWLNLMYPRLKIARELLSENGCIFISIDDNELDNLKKICNEIFGVKSFVAQFTRKGTGGRQDSKHFAIIHEYVICYAKNAQAFVSGKIIKEDEVYPFYDDEKKRYYKTQLLRKWGDKSRRSDRPNLYYPITDPDGNEHYPMLSEHEEGRWRWKKELMFNNISEGMVEFQKKDGKWIAYERIYEPLEGEEKTKLYSTILDDISANTGTTLIKELFGTKVFDYPKPVDLILRLIECANVGEDDIVLDFFSGSATSANAVFEKNVKADCNVHFIMIQYPELTYVFDKDGNKVEKAETKEAFDVGFENICEIGKERIRRAAKKIHEDNPDAKFDDGFKVFEVADTNIRWNTADDEEIKRLDEADYGNDKERIDFTKGYTDIDVVYEIMLRQFDIPLSTPVEKLPQVSDRTYIFADAVVVCLEPEITTGLIEKLAAIEPTPAKFVLRDSAFNDDIQLKDVSFRRLSALIKNHQTEEERKSKYNNYTVEFI